MIKVSWATFFLIYLFGYLFILFSLWIFSHLRQKKRSHSLPQHAVSICEFCKSPYQTRKEEKLSRCPVCKSMN